MGITLSQMFYEINRNLCETYPGLDPLKLLEYPAEDVFNLINGTIEYNKRKKVTHKGNTSSVIRRQAGDDWF